MGPVKVIREPFLIWNDAVRVSNGEVDLVFVPQIGRIMRYGYAGGPNLLWTAQETLDQPFLDVGSWRNYGGDKLWPAPQSEWGWPPDPQLDGVAHRVVLLADGFRAVGPPSPRSGIRFERTVRLARAGSGVTLENRMTNLTDRPMTRAIWQITQVNDPDDTRLPYVGSELASPGWAAYDPKFPMGGYLEEKNGEVVIRRHPGKSLKFGAGSPRGYVASRHGSTLFTMSSRYERGAPYPDEGRAQQIYTNQDPAKYAELELNAPLRPVGPGKTVRMTVRWRLEQLPKP